MVSLTQAVGHDQSNTVRQSVTVSLTRSASSTRNDYHCVLKTLCPCVKITLAHALRRTFFADFRHAGPSPPSPPLDRGRCGWRRCGCGSGQRASEQLRPVPFHHQVQEEPQEAREQEASTPGGGARPAQPVRLRALRGGVPVGSRAELSRAREARAGVSPHVLRVPQGFQRRSVLQRPPGQARPVQGDPLRDVRQALPVHLQPGTSRPLPAPGPEGPLPVRGGRVPGPVLHEDGQEGPHQHRSHRAGPRLPRLLLDVQVENCSASPQAEDWTLRFCRCRSDS